MEGIVVESACPLLLDDSVLLRRFIVMLAITVPMSGCSLMFVVRPPPGDGPVRPGDCMTSRVVPAIDTLGAGLYIGAVLVAEIPEELEVSDAAVRATWGVWGAGLAASAVLGSRSTNEYRARIEEHLESQAGRDPALVITIPAPSLQRDPQVTSASRIRVGLP